MLATLAAERRGDSISGQTHKHGRTTQASHSPSLPVPMSWSSIARICAWADMFLRVLSERCVSHSSWLSYFAHMQPPPLQGLPRWAPPPQPKTSPSRASKRSSSSAAVLVLLPMLNRRLRCNHTLFCNEKFATTGGWLRGQLRKCSVLFENCPRPWAVSRGLDKRAAA